jgi:hypothetical protein
MLKSKNVEVNEINLQLSPLSVVTFTKKTQLLSLSLVARNGSSRNMSDEDQHNSSILEETASTLGL